MGPSLSRARQRLTFRGSEAYWEARYRRGGTSGEGSYGERADYKAHFLNAFVRENAVRSVIELGSGDGNQLTLADYPSYIGLDVSPTAIRKCALRFADDHTKSFFVYDDRCFVDRHGLFRAELALSLDVVYHLVEDRSFELHLAHLFDAATRFAVVYSTDDAIESRSPHVRHRRFTTWVTSNRPAWRLARVEENPFREESAPDFFVFERI